jgi:hypothetical protein
VAVIIVWRIVNERIGHLLCVVQRKSERKEKRGIRLMNECSIVLCAWKG